MPTQICRKVLKRACALLIQIHWNKWINLAYRCVCVCVFSLEWSKIHIINPRYVTCAFLVIFGEPLFLLSDRSSVNPFLFFIFLQCGCICIRYSLNYEMAFGCLFVSTNLNILSFECVCVCLCVLYMVFRPKYRPPTN